MKYILLLLLSVILISSNINSQIPNAGFEDWGENGSPVGWFATNVPPSYTTIKKTNDAYSGSWAVEGSVAQFSVFTISPSMYSGPESQGVPVNFRPAALQGYYKLLSVEGDLLEIQANFRKNGIYMGVGAAILEPASTYTKFSIGILYNGEEIPDTVLIAIFVLNSSVFTHIGTKMYIDELSWGNSTDVAGILDQLPNNFKLGQNYPNPFNPSTVISYQLPATSQVSLKIYDIIGNEVATLVNEEKPAGSYEIKFDASLFSSGVYYYQLMAGEFNEVKKMLLMK